MSRKQITTQVDKFSQQIGRKNGESHVRRANRRQGWDLPGMPTAKAKGFYKIHPRRHIKNGLVKQCVEAAVIEKQRTYRTSRVGQRLKEFEVRAAFIHRNRRPSFFAGCSKRKNHDGLLRIHSNTGTEASCKANEDTITAGTEKS